MFSLDYCLYFSILTTSTDLFVNDCRCVTTTTTTTATSVNFCHHLLFLCEIDTCGQIEYPIKQPQTTFEDDIKFDLDEFIDSLRVEFEVAMTSLENVIFVSFRFR